MTPDEFIEKWSASTLKERSGSQAHFIDLCRLLDEPTPTDVDSTGEEYCFERGAQKDTGSKGWADVWKRGHFAWEYKSEGESLDTAFDQLRGYVMALGNPPLLVVSDMKRFRIHTNWTNTVSEVHELDLKDLRDASKREKLKWVMSDPEKLRPGQTRQHLTEKAASTFASIAQALRARKHDSYEVAHFINRIVFCMFAEDVGLLPEKLFTRVLKESRSKPDKFLELASRLFSVMATGGHFGVDSIIQFNGGLFDDDSALPLNRGDIDKMLTVSRMDWSEIDPSILGTLFERGLDPDNRAQAGVHYTDQDKIMKIVNPVVIEPWLVEWDRTKKEISKLLNKAKGVKAKGAKKRYYNQANKLVKDFLKALRDFKVLDPACGSGNFLFLALHALKDMEHLVQLEAEAMGFGFGREFPVIGPANVKGIETNLYAAELASVSIWIGEIQWMRRNGFKGSVKPVLKPLQTIECRDAILNFSFGEEREPEWPDADVIIGNPPFLGKNRQRSRLGEEYTEALRRVYGSRISGDADLVCYWFDKASCLVAEGKASRVGLVATNSIRHGGSRSVLEGILEHGVIFNAWSDEEWIIDGADVRVSLICFSGKGAAYQPVLLNDSKTETINADLSDENLRVTKAQKLSYNAGVAFTGIIKRGSFDIPGELAREWLQAPKNPNGRPNSDVLKPLMNGQDAVQRSKDKWIIDFGAKIESEAALYEKPFSYVLEHVKPSRERLNKGHSRERWWQHEGQNTGMWAALDGLSRCIATPRASRHRIFVWLDTRICPDQQLTVIARDDDTTFGILHSRFHEAWSLRLASRLGVGNDPRYTSTKTFQTFPFPEGLTPDIPASDYADNPHSIAIAKAARDLEEKRSRWLNPPEWTDRVDEPVPGYPKRLVPRDAASEKKLKARTLTNLYNDRPRWLDDAHAVLDAAVANAYGWPSDISEQHALEKLLELNFKLGEAKRR